MDNLDIEKIQNKRFILISETHGVKENIYILKEFISLFEEHNISVNLGLEWPSEISIELKNFLKKEKNTLNYENWEFVSDLDGRISKEHLDFLRWFKEKNKGPLSNVGHDLFCFSESDNSWNNRDDKMAKNIKEESEKSDKALLISLGKLHARKEVIKIDGEIHKPLATYLPKEELVTFNCIYQAGSYFNYKIREFNISEKNISDKIQVKDSDDVNFDYSIIVPKANSITPIIL